MRKRSRYCIETNTPTRINANVRNTGLITNLPLNSCVEVPCLVDNLGIHPCYVGDLPAQCAAVSRLRQNQDELAVKGALDQVRAMVAELFAADAPYLLQFGGTG